MTLQLLKPLFSLTRFCKENIEVIIMPTLLLLLPSDHQAFQPMASQGLLKVVIHA